MAKKPETVFWNRIKPKLKSIPNSHWEKTEAGANRGVPDVVGCINGYYIAMELKKDPKAKVSDMQLYKLRKINEAGGIGFIVYPENWDEVFKYLFSLAASFP